MRSAVPLLTACGLVLASCSGPTQPTPAVATPTASTVTSPGTVSLTSLTVEPAAITIGESFTLRWVGTGGTVSLARKGQQPFVSGLASSGSRTMQSGSPGYPSEPGDAAFEAVIGDAAIRKEASLQVNAVRRDEPPTVSLSSPASGTHVRGTVTITADAADDVGVERVRFQVDGKDIGAEVRRSPFAFSWDSSVHTDGTHSLTATARDGAGAETVSAAVDVVVDNTPPTVVLTSPAAGVCECSVTAKANATDNLGVAGVQFKVDGKDIGGLDTAAPYAVELDLDGHHDEATLTAVARDHAGNETTSRTVSIRVGNEILFVCARTCD